MLRNRAEPQRRLRVRRGVLRAAATRWACASTTRRSPSDADRIAQRTLVGVRDLDAVGVPAPALPVRQTPGARSRPISVTRFNGPPSSGVTAMASLSASSRLAFARCALLAAVRRLPRAAKLRVVASLPDVADMARQIGGDRVSVETIAEGSQDPHKVPVKPSFVTKLNRADALVVQGLGLEHAFLPALLEAARNDRDHAAAPRLHRRVALHRAARGAEQPEPHAGRAAPARQSALQSRSGAGQADGARDRRGARARRPGRRRAPIARARALHARCSTRKIAEWQKLAAPLRGREGGLLPPGPDLPRAIATGSSWSARSRRSRAFRRRRAISRSC